MKETTPKCTAVFDALGGITNSEQLKRGIALAIADITSKRITASMASAMANLIRQMLYTVKLEEQFGSTNGLAGRVLELTAGAPGR